MVSRQGSRSPRTTVQMDDKNEEIIALALSLEGKDAAAQKVILVQLFGDNELGNKRRYKALAIQLHPDKNRSRSKEATQAMQLFLGAMDHQLKVHAASGVPLMERLAVERVKLGLRLVGEQVMLKDAGPWSSVPMRLVDFNEDTLRFSAERPSGSLWTGLLAIHPEDAKVHILRLSSHDAVNTLTELKVQQSHGHRLSRGLISNLDERLGLKHTLGSWRPLSFSDFGPQKMLKMAEQEGCMEIAESQWLMFEQSFTNALVRASSSSSSPHRVEARVLQVLPPQVKTRLGPNGQGMELALVQLVSPFESEDSLSLGNISHDLVEAFVLRQRLGSEKMEALTHQAEEKLMQLADGQVDEEKEKHAPGIRAEAASGSMALRVADEVDKLVIAESKQNFRSAPGSGILHQQANQKEPMWFQFDARDSAGQYVKRLVGLSGIGRSKIQPAERIQFICVHPRANQRIARTDEYILSLHDALGKDYRCCERETVDSKLLDDFIAQGVITRCTMPQKAAISICDAASAGEASSGYVQAVDSEAEAMQQKVSELVDLARSILGKEIPKDRAEKELRMCGGSLDMAMGRLMG